MKPPPLEVRDFRKVDADHLNLLMVFHFVGAGLAVLGIGFLAAHFAVFHLIMANPRMWQDSKAGPSPGEIFAVLKWFYLILGLWFLNSAVLNIISDFCIRARKGRTFSLVTAGINCVHLPLGTVLGIFTIIVLLRDSVRELYEVKRS